MVVEIVETVLRVSEHGGSVIPCCRDKKPCLPWAEFQRLRASPEQIRAWSLRYAPASWALVTGSVSGIFVCDFDGLEGRETLRKLGLNPHIETGSGGAHVWVRTDGHHVRTLNAKTKLELGRKWPAMDIRGDGGYAIFVGSNARGEYRVAKDLTPYPTTCLPNDLLEFLGIVKKPEEPKPAHSTPPSQAVPAEAMVFKALDMVDNGSGRNNAGFWLACQFRDNAYPEENALQVGLDLFVPKLPGINTKGEPELYKDDEWTATVRQAYTHARREPWTWGNQGNGTTPEPAREPGEEPEGKKVETRFRFWSVEEVAKLPAPDWLIDEILPEDSLAVLYGAPGSGKSFVALDMGLSIAYGIPWHGRDTRMFSVVYVAGEGFSGLSKRLRAWASGIQLDDPLRADCGRFRACPDMPMLLNFADAKAFTDAMQEMQPALVVVDTLARAAAGGEENSAKDMGVMLGACDNIRKEYGCCVLLIHHSDKLGESLRGSSAILAAVDVCFRTTSEASQGGGQDGKVTSRVVNLTQEKSKDTESNLTLSFGMQVVGVGEDKKGRLLTSCRLTDSGHSMGLLPNHCQPVLARLHEAAGEDGITSCQWLACCEGISDRTYFRSRKYLVENGYVQITPTGRGDRYHVSEKGRLVSLPLLPRTATLPWQ